MQTSEIYRLIDLKPGDQAFVIGTDDWSTALARLGDFGICKGTFVRCVRVGFLGDPTAYRFGSNAMSGNAESSIGTVIAIRRQDAVHIQITEPEKLTASRKGGKAWA